MSEEHVEPNESKTLPACVAAETRGRYLLRLGWILFALSFLAIVGSFSRPHQRDMSVESFLTSPDRLNMAGTIGFLVGINALAISSLLVAIVSVWKYRRGANLVAFAFVMITLNSALALRPSVESADRVVSNAEYSYETYYLVERGDVEFTARLPQEPKYSFSQVNGYDVHMYSCEGVDSNAYYRVELCPLGEQLAKNADLRSLLTRYTVLANIPDPEIKTTTSQNGLKGSYSGFKQAGPYMMRLYGETTLGELSMISTFVIEPLDESPSDEALMVLNSVASAYSR